MGHYSSKGQVGVWGGRQPSPVHWSSRKVRSMSCGSCRGSGLWAGGAGNRVKGTGSDKGVGGGRLGTHSKGGRQLIK